MAYPNEVTAAPAPAAAPITYAAPPLHLVNLSMWVFILTVVLLPLGLGGNRPIPFALAQIGLAASAVLLLLSQTAADGFRLPMRLRVALGLLGAVVVWGFLQTTGFVPSSWAHPIWQEAEIVLGQKLGATIALQPENARAGLVRLITYIFCGVLAFCLAQEVKRAWRMVRILWIAVVVICVYGLAVQITGLEMVLWFDKEAYRGDLTASFISRNHFAIYAGMGLVCGSALLVQSWRKHMYGVRPTARIEAIRNWLQKKAALRGLFILLALLAILLSHSRAGLVLSMVGLGSYLFFHQIYAKKYKRAAIVILVAALLLGISFAFATQFSDRFASLFNDYSAQDRARVYGILGQAIKDNPLLGYGMNSFEAVYRLYQHGSSMEFNHAHSDVLEVLLEYGVLFGLLLWGAVILCISGLWHGVTTRRRHGLFATLGLAVTVMILCHGMVDFSLQIPGVTFYWVTLMGIGLAQSWGGERERS
jgi:O-antigen ligase